MLIATTLLALLAQEPPPKAEKRSDFLRRLYEKDRAGFGDALRLAVGLAKDAPAEGDAAATRQEAVGLGLIDPAWDLADGAPLSKGTLAFMLMKALNIKGGVTTAIFGPSRRYAFRELVYLRLMKGGADMEYVTGRELLDILTNAELYKRAGSLDAERK
jgi:hypothetical protein